MKFFPFVLKHLLRNWVRSASTVVAMALCVFLFCTLQSAVSRFNRVVDTRSPKRLVTHNERPTVVLPGAGYAEPIAGVQVPERASGVAPTIREYVWDSVGVELDVDGARKAAKVNLSGGGAGAGAGESDGAEDTCEREGFCHGCG